MLLISLGSMKTYLLDDTGIEPQQNQKERKLPYNTYLQNVLNFRDSLNMIYTNIPEKKDSIIKIARENLYTAISQEIIEYWKGTQWDFNGYSKVPGKGVIACGYFVTTPLKQLGFNLNRYKIAQQYSHSIVKTLCYDSVYTFCDSSSFIDFLQKQDENGVFIVGLDYHTGFIIKNNDQSYFMHSDYLNKEGVKKETVESSEALSLTTCYVIGDFLKNDEIIKAWITKDTIDIRN